MKRAARPIRNLPGYDLELRLGTINARLDAIEDTLEMLGGGADVQQSRELLKNRRARLRHQAHELKRG